MACSHCRDEGHNRRACPDLADERPEKKRTKHRYSEVFASLDDPPTDALELAEWCQKVNALALKETLQGRGNRSLNQEIRSFSATVIKLIPMERLLRLKRKLEARKKKTAKKPTKRKKGPPPTPASPSTTPPIRG